MKKFLASLSALIIPVCGAWAEGDSNSFTLSAYGFFDVRSYFDDRSSVLAAGDYLYLYPLDENIQGGTDLNESHSASLMGASARLGFNLTGPEAFGAKSRANLEMEFYNYSSSGHFLFRHAYFALDWSQATLTAGQTWHPMADMIPTTVSIALGSPFNGLNRSSQLRYDYKLGEFKLSTAAIFQSLSSSTGPSGKSNSYQKSSMIPELYVGVQWQADALMLGGGIEWQKLSPVSVGGDKQYVEGFAGMLQARYKTDRLNVMAKTFIGENMSHLGLCTGYAKELYSADEWCPLMAQSSWLSAEYGASLKVGAFCGFMQNLGSKNEIDLTQVYSTGGDIDCMYRIAPNLKYTFSNITLAAEYDITSVAYGVRKTDALVWGDGWVTNHRLLFTAIYKFSL